MGRIDKKKYFLVGSFIISLTIINLLRVSLHKWRNVSSDTFIVYNSAKMFMISKVNPSVAVILTALDEQKFYFFL